MTEVTIKYLSEHIGAEWEKLAAYLGFHRHEIEHFRCDHFRTNEAIFAMLMSCRNRHHNCFDFREELRRALVKIERRDLAERVSAPAEKKGNIIFVITKNKTKQNKKQKTKQNKTTKTTNKNKTEQKQTNIQNTHTPHIPPPHIQNTAACKRFFDHERYIGMLI